MNFKVTLLPGGEEFAADGHRSLLDAALAAGFFPPHKCRSGFCGTCKNQILSGCVDHRDAMFSVLSAAERQRGVLLFCCARPLSDLIVERRDIEVPGEIRIKRLMACVRAVAMLSPDCIRFTLELPSNRRLCFRAGQCVDILRPDGRRTRGTVQAESTGWRVLELDVQCAEGDLNSILFDAQPGHKCASKALTKAGEPHQLVCLQSQASPERYTGHVLKRVRVCARIGAFVAAAERVRGNPFVARVSP